ncbi:hypothetical protein KBY57_13120 [Cyanobium sp. Aljojuca 7D2]|uniref:DUF6932 family protein n=1 Tax=Cyanobium sp. Aljojuca 7D2 TaxID=2823698 RepID=UPI0020CF058B|nr:hypothetical protein [Cyanobium sp. Aljojuca 7D2]MCP9891986.1 hypothetical protein [Cyanobium sp. Aljojuca 7D2]
MPIPSFDRFGLLPGGIHECTIKEVEVDLAWNDERRRLTALLQEFIAIELTPRFTVLPPVLLDGSYVSKKASPNNINLVLELSSLSDEEQWEGQILFQRKAELLGCYQIEMLPGLKGLKQDFVDLLQTLRPQTAFEKGLHHGHRKGVLRLI